MTNEGHQFCFTADSDSTIVRARMEESAEGCWYLEVDLLHYGGEKGSITVEMNVDTIVCRKYGYPFKTYPWSTHGVGDVSLNAIVAAVRYQMYCDAFNTTGER